MEISIIIVNWHSSADLQQCLESLRRFAPRVAYEVIVVDAGSFDGCAAMLAQHFPDVRFVQCPTNRGFAGSNNLGAAVATGSALLFLNPDTILTEAAIDHLHQTLQTQPDAGAVGSRLLNRDGSVQTSCVQAFPTILNQALNSEFLRRRFPRSRLWGNAVLLEQGEGPRRVEVISGACLMIRRATFEAVGRFSEDYFMYSEDVDLSAKVMDAGFTNYFQPEATVVHLGGQSSSSAGSQFASVMLREATRRFLSKRRGVAYSLAFRLVTAGCAIGRVGLLGGAWLTGRRTPEAAASAQKWRAVLRWACGDDQVTRQYYRHPSLAETSPPR